MKCLVSPGKCVSFEGKAHPAGTIVELPADVAQRLLKKQSVTDPTKPLIAPEGVLAEDDFKRNPKQKKDGDKSAPPSAPGEAPVAGDPATGSGSEVDAALAAIVQS